MSLANLVHGYGYLAVLIGTLLEGETILVLGGVAAQQGYLALPWVMVAACVGSVSGDQIFFYAGRSYGFRFLEGRPRLQRVAGLLQNWLHRHQNWLLGTFRFLYGLRTAAPFVFGAAGVGRARFLLFDAIGGAVWSVVLGYGGYLAGQAVSAFLGHVIHYELELLLVVAAGGAGVWLVWRYWR